MRLIDQKGGSSRALTADAGQSGDGQVLYAAPTWAPDGTRLAFARMAVNGARELTDSSLYTAARNGRRLTRVLSGSRLRPFFLYWSPDSRMVSLLSSVDGETSLEMGLVPAVSTEGAYQALDRGAPFYWAWRADSHAIVEHVNERMAVLGVGPQAASAPIKVDPGEFQAPSYSPDGRSVAWASTSESVSTLHVSAADGSVDRTFASDKGGMFLEFSRDGRRLAYLAALRSQPVPMGTLTVVDVSARTNGAPTKLPAGKALIVKEAPVIEFFWSPDGRTLAFVMPDSPQAVDPAFLQSDNLAYVRLMGCDVASGRTWTIARFPPSRGFFNVLPYFDQYQRSSTPWSPDSRFISFTAITSGGTPGVFVAPARGTITPRLVALGDNAFWSLR